MPKTTDLSQHCTTGGACCGRCHAGRDQRMQALLREMLALGTVLPGQVSTPQAASRLPEPDPRAGGDPRPA